MSVSVERSNLNSGIKKILDVLHWVAVFIYFVPIFRWAIWLYNGWCLCALIVSWILGMDVWFYAVKLAIVFGLTVVWLSFIEIYKE